jgi:hypothetical protein
MSSWTPAGTGIWIRSYNFGGNPINTMAVDMGDGNLMAISPGTDLTDADFEELDGLGTVKALVTPGSFHHMGLPIWSERYPEAGLYGPTSAAAHIAGQHKELKPLQDLEALKVLLSDEFVVEELAGCKHPDMFMCLQRDGATTWFTNEVVSNNADYPAGFMLKWAFKLSGNHPGLNVNSLAAMLIRAKKPLVRAYLEEKIESHPPTRLVPCHGDVIDDAALGTQLREVLARRF